MEKADSRERLTDAYTDLSCWWAGTIITLCGIPGGVAYQQHCVYALLVMKWVANAIIALGSAATALSFGFLLVVMLLLAKFRRFKGFGFEAEMWEEKQPKPKT